MNKLVTVFSALAVAAGIAQGEVKSANIVGYQDFNGSGSFNLTGPTFVDIGTDGSAAKLGDIKVNSSFEFMSDTITVFDSTGNILYSATYLDQATADEAEMNAGWYDADKAAEEDYVEINNYEFPYGSSLAFRRSNASAVLKYTGEVVQSSYTINGSGTFNLIANTSPVALKLGDITVNSSFEFMSDMITIFNSLGNIVFRATYLDQATADEAEMSAGWYDATEAESENYVEKNDYDVPASMGFAFNRANASAAIIIPEPIKK